VKTTVPVAPAARDLSVLKLRFSHLWCSCSCRPGNRTPNRRSLHPPPGGKGRARARVCGRRPTSSVKRGGGKYLCYDCLKKGKRPGKVPPLPGVLERSEENLWFSGPPNVCPGEGGDRPVRCLRGEEGGVSVAGGAGGGVWGATVRRTGARAPSGARCNGSQNRSMSTA